MDNYKLIRRCSRKARQFQNQQDSGILHERRTRKELNSIIQSVEQLTHETQSLDGHPLGLPVTHPGMDVAMSIGILPLSEYHSENNSPA